MTAKKRYALFGRSAEVKLRSIAGANKYRSKVLYVKKAAFHTETVKCEKAAKGLSAKLVIYAYAGEIFHFSVLSPDFSG